MNRLMLHRTHSTLLVGGNRFSSLAVLKEPARSQEAFRPLVARLLPQEAESYAAALSKAGMLPAEDSNSFREQLRGKCINHGNSFPKDVVDPKL